MDRKHRAGIVGACIIAIATLVVVVVMARGGESAAPPQQPDDGVISEQVSWPIGETNVHATITRPDGDGPYPALVFVSRTGFTDRNWNVPQLPGTNGSGRLLAAELARHDFVTIRYDKRHVGPGAEENLPHLAGNISLAGHIEEIAGAIQTLLAQDYVDPDEIYVLSHGEGAPLTLHYHLEHDGRIAGLVITAPPSRPIADLFIEQVRAQFQHLPERDDIVAGCEALMASFLAGEPFVPHPEVPPSLNNYVSSLYDPRNLPFVREIMALDPADLLMQLNVPALVVIGQKDAQVDWEVDGGLLQAATTDLAHIEYEFPENADHVLKYQPKPREEVTQDDARDYNAADRVLDPETVEAIVNWLMQQTQAD
ncbi:MAG: alpha/beta hydrolase [Dehalococcoidia bacterium]|nr:alpha/beta hydrolase [Dehalococcoidia bacterium]